MTPSLKTLQSSIDNIIQQRRSVRTFDALKDIDPLIIEELRTCAHDAYSPFGGRVYIELKKFDLTGAFKPSTYGTIKGASWYFLLGTDSSVEAQLSLGFRMEQVVLKATSLGLGTCWIAATFKGTDFADVCDFPADIPPQVVIPVGYPADKVSLREKLTRMAVGSAKRKPMSELFSVSEQSRFYHPLEMMRLAPSSTNSQPWRADADGDTLYFYYVDKSKASILDLGIGLSHFYLSAAELGIHGEFNLCNQAPAHNGWIPLVKFHER